MGGCFMREPDVDFNGPGESLALSVGALCMEICSLFVCVTN